jgi:hypothetical protein
MQCPLQEPKQVEVCLVDVDQLVQAMIRVQEAVLHVDQ